MRVDIHPEDNPEATELSEESNQLGKRWKALNDEVLKLRTPILRVWRLKKTMKAMAPTIKQYELDWSTWDIRVRQFTNFPRFVIPSGGRSDIVFLHWTAQFRERTSQMRADMRLLESNFNHQWESYQDQRNLLLTWVGLMLSLVGLAAALLAV